MPITEMPYCMTHYRHYPSHDHCPFYYHHPSYRYYLIPCPSPQEKLNCRAVVKVRYGVGRRRFAGAADAAGGATQSNTAPAAGAKASTATS